jgi:type VI secretion system VasD/TssJ family lipoprotein
MTRTMSQGAKFIGVFAAFRDFENATWRTVVAVPDNRTTPVTVTLSDRSLAAVAGPGS